jgi:hypothetical protein
MKAPFNGVGPANEAIDIQPITILSPQVIERNMRWVGEITLSHRVEGIFDHLFCIVGEEGTPAVFSRALHVRVSVEQLLQPLQ